MVRSALGKVAWVGRTASMVFGLALVMALVLGVATMAFGANGQNFVLGKLNNAATKVTGLVGNVDGGAALRVTNPNAGANDTALDLRVQAGEAPMRVNSATRVPNLNADKLDGLSLNQLVRSGLGTTQDAVPFVSFTDRQAVTVNAPAKGFVLVNGTVVANTSSTSCNPCYTFARVRHDNNQALSVAPLGSLGNGTTSTHRETLPMSWVFPVEAGANTFTLRTGTFPDPSPVSFFNPTLTAMYVPFGSSGTDVLGATSKAISSMQGEQGQSSDGVVVK